MKKLFDTYKQHYKALLLLGLPIVVGQLGVIVLGFADTLMIGHHSTEELGAASFVNNLFTLCIIFSTGFSYGLTPVVGGFYGNRRFADSCHGCSLFQCGAAGTARRIAASNQALLSGVACFTGLCHAVQRFQTVYGRHHRYQDGHVDSARRECA